MKIQVTKKSQYGRERIFPVNRLAATLLVLIGRKTFNDREIEILNNEGFEIEYVDQPAS